MTNKRPYPQRLAFSVGARALAVTLALSLGACANQKPFGDPVASLHGQVIPPITDFDFHAVTPAMEAFTAQHTGAKGSRDQRAGTLIWALTNEFMFPFAYDPGLTLSSVETFEQHSGNCLSFSSMLVAMARRAGLEAWYQEVEIPPQWQSVNRTLLVSMHINVVIQGNHDQWVVDISGKDSSKGRKVKRISDADAKAQYFNNQGAGALTAGNLALAYAYFRKAIAISPDQAYLWSNLAVVYTRNNQSEDARRAYLAALDIDGDNPVAANNLYMIYKRAGNYDAAQKLLARVERHRRTNPYYLFHLSSLAYEEGRYEESREMLEKAIVLKEQEYRFHYELARLQAADGDLVAAEASLERALQLAPDLPWLGSAEVDRLPPLPE